MGDLTKEMTGMSSLELVSYDFPNPCGEETLKDNEKRRKELRRHYQITRFMGYVERVVGRFYST